MNCSMFLADTYLGPFLYSDLDEDHGASTKPMNLLWSRIRRLQRLMNYDPSDLGSLILIQITVKERAHTFVQKRSTVHFKTLGRYSLLLTCQTSSEPKFEGKWTSSLWLAAFKRRFRHFKVVNSSTAQNSWHSLIASSRSFGVGV